MDMQVKKIKNLGSNEQGFASIVIALVLILILSLLTIGFAQLARREQQNALQKQLSTQAYYAAESGINAAKKDISDGNLYDNTATGGSTDTSTTHCMGASTGLLPSYATYNSAVNAATGAYFSCLLVNLQPPDLVWSGVSPGADETSTFSTTGPLNKLTVYWASYDHQPTPRPTGSFSLPPAASWHSPAVLQVSITPMATITRAAMIASTFTVYLYPSSGGSNVTYDTTKQGQIIAASSCSGTGTYPCSVTIDGLPSTVANEQYSIHILDYYDTSNIAVGNARTAGNVLLKFVDGQAQIDVTGKARYVLKRVQVASPLAPVDTYPPPPYAAQGQNICKRLETQPTLTNPDGTDFVGIAGGFVNLPSTDPCDLSN